MRARLRGRRDAGTDMTDMIRLSSCAAWLSLALMAAGCTTQQASDPSTSVTVQGAIPPQRSYLDAGPVQQGGGRPNYVRANQTSATRQTDFFGNSVLPQVP